jgi:glycosyltransferase involved in cell wall biosynthesis
MFTETWLPTVNGVVTSVASSSLALRRAGHSVEIFAPKSKAGMKVALPGMRGIEQIPVHVFRSLVFKPYPDYNVTLPPVRINKLVKNRGFSVIHTHGPFSLGWAGLYCAKRNHIPCVSTFHTPISEYVEFLFGKHQRLVYVGKRIAWKYCTAYYNRCDAVIAPSGVVKKLLREKGVKRPVFVLPTGIDLDELDSVKRDKRVLKKFGIDRPFVLMHGRISPEKNPQDAILAMKRVRSGVMLVVTGKGPALEGMKALARREGVADRVRFLGFVENRDLFHLFHEALAGVMPSGADTQSMVIFEEMAFGMPILAADAMAFPEFIKDGYNGFLFPLHGSAKIASLIDRVAGDPRLRARLSKNARTVAESDSGERRAKELVALYASVGAK